MKMRLAKKDASTIGALIGGFLLSIHKHHQDVTDYVPFDPRKPVESTRKSPMSLSPSTRKRLFFIRVPVSPLWLAIQRYILFQTRFDWSCILLMTNQIRRFTQESAYHV